MSESDDAARSRRRATARAARACGSSLLRQTCVCADRGLVHAAVHDEFVARLAGVEALVVGHALARARRSGRSSRRRRPARARARLDDAVARGAEIVVGGRVGDGLGARARPAFAEPTVLTRDARDGRVAEENFAPVVAVARFETEAEALALANDSEGRGLGRAHSGS